MQTVAHLLASKKHWNEGDHGVSRIERVQTITEGSTALDAARKMNEHHVGSLVVIDGFEKICGIITERDILTRIVSDERDPASTRVSSVMTRDVIHCTPESSLTEVRHLMSDCKIRHIPVTDKGSLIGLVSIGDLNAASNADLSIEVKSMRQYIATG